MLIDWKVEDKTILIIGGGSVSEFKVNKLLLNQEKCKIIVVSKNFTKGLLKLGKENLIELKYYDIISDLNPINLLVENSSIMIITTDNHNLNERIAMEAHKKGGFVNVVDEFSLSDFSMPATLNIGDIKIAISTGGKSPAMSKILRNRFKSLITQEDLLQVKLQYYVRSLIKKIIPEIDKRREILYQIIENKEIKSLLKNNKIDEAKNFVHKYLNQQSRI